MRALAVSLVLSLVGKAAFADTIVASRTIRSQSILTAADLRLIENDRPGALGKLDQVIGMEARVVLYEGRVIRPQDIGPPAIIERNQVVTIVFATGGLTITADGRSLGRGGVGDTLRVMNLGSRKTVSGQVLENGMILVGNS